MIRFEHPEYFYILGVLPILIGVFWFFLRVRKKRLKNLGDRKLVMRLMPEFSKYKHTVKFILIFSGMLFLVMALANPQMGTSTRKVKRKSLDVFFALDISQSMMAEDLVPNRMERAKRFARTLAEQLAGERMGLITFAGNAYLQVPITDDYAHLDLMLRSANPNNAGTQGTAIADAVDLARRSFSPENQSHKVLIIISDGEDHEENAIQMVSEGVGEGLMVFSVGIGTGEGSFIPVTVRGRKDYKRDETGNPVRSALNEDMLRSIAEAGDGAYFNLGNDADQIAVAIQSRINQLDKKEMEQRIYDEFNSYFQIFLLIALIFLVIEFVLNYRRNHFVAEKDLFK
ncbi:MAG: VWA domain-containing protein [Bacteroidota bacterium]